MDHTTQPAALADLSGSLEELTLPVLQPDLSGRVAR
jgi:hypothetical protein